MKTINYPSNFSETDSETCCRPTKVVVDSKTKFPIFNKKIIKLLGTFLILFIIPSKSFSQEYYQAYVLTDKTDYYPGDYVQITGHNWLPGEAVMMVLEDYPVFHGHDTLYSIADSLGSFLNSEYLIQTYHLGQSFTLTTTGLSSGYVVETYFTDSPRITAVTFTPSTQTACIPLSGITTVTYTIKATRGSPPNGNGTVNGTYTVSGIPAGVSSSTLAGFTATGNNLFPDRILTLTISPSAVSGTYTISVTCSNGVNGPDQATGIGTLVLNTRPVITCPANITVNNDIGACSAIVNFTGTNAASATGVPTPSISYSPSSGTAFPKGTTSVIATAINSCGTSTCSFDVIVMDNELPVINGVGVAATINCRAEPLFSSPTVGDNCAGATLSFTDVTTPGSCPGNYSVTRTWTATDASNNTSTANQVITVQDTTAPLIDDAVASSTINCPAQPEFTIPGGSDECSTYTIVEVSDNSVGPPCNYTRTKTWHAIDNCGNISREVSQAITVQDVTVPLIDDAVASSTINCPAQPEFTIPGGSDECSTYTVVEVSDNSVGPPCNYTRTKTWHAIDNCGNISREVSQSITVQDITVPLIDDAVASSTINCPAQPEFTIPGGSDECSTYTVVEVSDNSVGPPCNYTRTKTWHAIDNCGNISREVSQSITVQDITVPLIDDAVASSTINCPAQPEFTIPSGSDECSTYTVVEVSDNSVGPPCNYTRTKTWHAIDNCGNISREVSQAITVQDITAPNISTPSDLIIDCPAQPAFTIPTAGDACSSATVIEVSDETVGGDCNYTRTKTWKAVDACGNESGLVSQAITVHDITAPSITAAASATLDCPAQPIFSTPTATDACSSATVIEVSDNTEGVVGSCSYTRTKTWKAVDACGNESGLVSQAITVHDVTPPSLTGEGADIFLRDCKATFEFTPPTASDLCDSNPIVNVVSTSTVQNADGSITHTRVWNAVDNCNNIASVDQAITISACEYCSLTQGFYGTANGVACATGERGDVLIKRLLNAPFGNLVVGKSGKSLTIDAAHSNCVTQRLASGTSAVVLPSGNFVFGNNCSTSIPVDSKGKFTNILLGQTISLGLNLRLNSALGGVILNGTTMTTIGSVPGADGKCGTLDDNANISSVITKSIPQSVLNALTNLYGNRSVTNLFDLANRALGGMSTGGASLSDINKAVSSINEGFDGCRFLKGFGSSSSRLEELEIINSENGFDPNIVTLKAIPNPFDAQTTLEFTSKVDSKVKVEVYNIAGIKVASLFNDQVKANEPQSVIFDGQYLPNGMYIYVLTTDDKSYYHKLLLVR